LHLDAAMMHAHFPQSHFSASDARTLGFGLLSLACGGAMIAAPRLFGPLFSLPRNRTLVRLLGVRDVLIGSALLVPASRRLGLALRALADTGDGVMIANELARKGTTRVRGAFSLAVAALSATASLRLALRDAAAH
jgi:hypothetical protein